MIRANDIQDRLIGLIGWRQISGQSFISENLAKSESGLYFQQAHPLLTLENLMSIAPNFKDQTAEDFDIEKPYKKNDIVSRETLIFKALKDCQGVPLTDKETWQQTTYFSEWLEDKTKASIYKAIASYMNSRINSGSFRNLFENKKLFDTTGRIYDTIRNKNNLVGFEIVPIRAKGVTTKINKIGLQFSKAGKYTIYIFHSSCEQPVYTFELEKIAENSMEWFSVENIYLPYESDTIDAGGSWFICYKQSQLNENNCEAIRKDRDWSKEPCKACSKNEFVSWSLWSRFLEIHPFYVNEELLPETKKLWDIEKNQYLYDSNFGINLDITVGCDISDFIIAQRSLFTDVILKQAACDFLREFAYNANARANKQTVNTSRIDILYEIDGDSSSMRKSGLSFQLEEALKAVTLSTTGLDKVCFACANNGVKYRTI